MIIGGLLVGVLCGLLGFIYLQLSNPAYNQDGGMTPVVVMMCFLIGSSMFSTIATVISSGVATTFVCLAEDPEALRRSKPELFEKVKIESLDDKTLILFFYYYYYYRFVRLGLVLLKAFKIIYFLIF